MRNGKCQSQNSHSNKSHLFEVSIIDKVDKSIETERDEWLYGVRGAENAAWLVHGYRVCFQGNEDVLESRERWCLHPRST